MCDQRKRNNVNILHDERALGFVESLIAILISGIACVALMTVAVRVIREAKASELRDASNQYALEGLELVRTLAATNPDAIKSPTFEKTYMFNEYHTELTKIDLGDRCSDYDNNGTECEKLDWASSERFFYREIDIKRAGSADLVKVSVRVGTIIESNNFRKEAEVTGYVPL